MEDILWTGNPASRVRDEFAPQEGDTIIHKTAFGAFTSSTMDETLRSMGLDTLIVTGIATNCCVSTIIRDAADLGYGCVLVEECTADYDPVSPFWSLRYVTSADVTAADTVTVAVGLRGSPARLIQS